MSSFLACVSLLGAVGDRQTVYGVSEGVKPRWDGAPIECRAARRACPEGQRTGPCAAPLGTIEIISPDAFPSPFLAGCATLSAIYDVVRRAYAKQVYVDRDFQAETNELVQQHVGAGTIGAIPDFAPSPCCQSSGFDLSIVMVVI